MVCSPRNFDTRVPALLLLTVLALTNLATVSSAGPDAPLEQLQAHSVEMHEHLRPTVVSVLCEVKGEDNPKQGPYYGTGVITTESGYILTSTSVVPPGAKDIRIILHNRKKKSARLVGASLRFEISLLKMEGDNYSDLDLGDSEALELGSQVYSAGNAFGLSHQQGHISFSSGIVSGLYSTESVYWQSQYNGLQMEVDSSINPGTDGGPIINRKGELVGVISLTADRARWMGMAVPVHLFRSYTRLLRSYEEDETAHTGTPYLGLEMRNTDRSDPTGIRVTSVTERSPAWFAGLREGDLVYRATGKNVKKLSDFDTIMQNQSVGDQFLVFVERDSQRWSILMKVGARPL